MFCKKIKIEKLAAFFLFSFVVPLVGYRIEETDEASIDKFNPQGNGGWKLEVRNKTKEPIVLTAGYNPNDTNGILSFKLGPGETARSDLFLGILLYVFIWKNTLSKPNRAPDLRKIVDARGDKTAYLSYRKDLRVQKGKKGKTQSGLFLLNNISDNDIINVR